MNITAPPVNGSKDSSILPVHLRLLPQALVLLLLLPSCESAKEPALERTALVSTEWAREPMLRNPVALSHDPSGKLYVTETQRRRESDLDIRQMQGLEPLPWQVLEATLQTVEDRQELIRRVLAPGSRANNPWMKDRNGDERTDWNDLTTISEMVHVLDDEDHDGVADQSRVFADGFNTEITGVAGGVLWDDGSVYMTVFPDLWRLEDTDGDGSADTKQSLATGMGVHIGQGGHDLHGITKGPDGKIYWSLGDKGFSTTTREGELLHYPNQGAVLRANPDGSELEVYAHGLRNCQELGFDDFGNWFCVDNDGDFDGERERFVYLAEGSDSGWRINWQMNLTNRWAEQNGIPNYNPWMDESLSIPAHPGQAAYITPPLSNYSNGPCGLVRNPGTALSEAYEDTWFLSQFPGKLVTGFKIAPKGSAFEMVDEHVVSDDIIATGLSFGPDGALYVADWDGDWAPNDRGAIHRFDVDPAEAHPLRARTEELIEQGMSDRSDDELAGLLAYADQRVRLEAQFELVSRGKGGLFAAILEDRPEKLAAVHAMWGLGQLARAGEVVDENLVRTLLDSEDEEIQTQAIRLVAAAGVPNADELLAPFLASAHPRHPFEAAMALSRVGSATSFDGLIRLAAAHPDDPWIRHAVVMGLQRAGSTSSLRGLMSNVSVGARLAGVVALRRMASPAVADFLSDSDELVVLEAARAINDDLSIPEALPALGDLLDGDSDREAILRRAINAAVRMGTPDQANRLLAFSLNESKPSGMRMEAMAALSTWDAPPILDRVDRRYRPEVESSRAGIGPAIAARKSDLLAIADPTVLSAGISLVDAFALDVPQAQLQTWLGDDEAPLDLRLSSLELLLKSDNESVRLAAVSRALSDDDIALRSAALTSLGARSPLEAIDRINAIVASDAPDQEKQLAIRALGTVQHPRAAERLGELVDGIADDSIPLALHLDIFESARDAGGPGIMAKLMEAATFMSSTDPLVRYGLALEGGNPDLGKEAFFNHETAQCVRCHATGENAGLVGPDLTGIGERHDRTYLLQSLVDPAAVLTEGYEAGGVSAMPPMGDVLSARELRDVVAYLASM